MKTRKYQRRFYRDWIAAKDLRLRRVVVGETDLQILTDKAVDEKFIRGRVSLYRRQIETYIAKDRRFLTSLKPLAVELRAPMIVKKMSQAAKTANVGPMAAVAGAIAEFLGRDLLKKGCREVIIENGGDIFLKITKTRSVGIYAGRKKIWNRLALRIKPQDTPLGISSSSGSVGHSLSFGEADCAIILSGDTCLADAVATAAGNRVKTSKDLTRAIDFARSIRGVRGVVIILKKNLISWGRVEFKNP